METNDRADVLGALLTQGRLPRLGSGGDYLAYDVEWTSWQRAEAERLYHAEQCRLPEALVSRRRKGLTLEDAYRVQWCGAALRVREGARVLGHKVGPTSKAMQHQVGIDTPDSGILLDSMVMDPGEALRAAELLSPRIEAEIAFHVGMDLCGTGVVEEAARGAMAEVFLALEVIDSRFHLDGITLADSVADNAACARFALGEAVPMPSWDLRAERLTAPSQTEGRRDRRRAARDRPGREAHQLHHADLCARRGKKQRHRGPAPGRPDGLRHLHRGHRRRDRFRYRRRLRRLQRGRAPRPLG